MTTATTTDHARRALFLGHSLGATPAAIERMERELAQAECATDGHAATFYPVGHRLPTCDRCGVAFLDWGDDED